MPAAAATKANPQPATSFTLTAFHQVRNPQAAQTVAFRTGPHVVPYRPVKDRIGKSHSCCQCDNCQYERQNEEEFHGQSPMMVFASLTNSAWPLEDFSCRLNLRGSLIFASSAVMNDTSLFIVILLCVILYLKSAASRRQGYRDENSFSPILLPMTPPTMLITPPGIAIHKLADSNPILLSTTPIIASVNPA